MVSKAWKRDAASSAKQQNISVLGTLLGNGVITPADGAHWFAVIDRARALATQQTLTKMFNTWLTTANENKKVKQEYQRENADLERRLAAEHKKLADLKRN